MYLAHAGHDHTNVAKNDMTVDPTMLLIVAGISVLLFAGFVLFRHYRANRI